MKIELDTISDQNIKINGYTSNSITINGHTYSENLIITQDSIYTENLPSEFSDLAIQTITQIISANPEILIIGTGKTQQFLPDSLVSVIQQAEIGLETMDTFAACRCFNLLCSEGRLVSALLFQEVK